VNVPLARWLTAWAASAEESLRALALRGGPDELRRFLRDQPPYRKASGAADRWAELGGTGHGTVVGLAELTDLLRFAKRTVGPTAGRILNRYRNAHNQVIHQRAVRVGDLPAIADAVQWLSGQGLV